MEEAADGDPGKCRALGPHQDVGASGCGCTKSTVKARSRPARGKGRRELGIGGLRQAGLAKWAAMTAGGTSGYAKRQSSTGLKEARLTQKPRNLASEGRKGQVERQRRTRAREELRLCDKEEGYEMKIVKIM